MRTRKLSQKHLIFAVFAHDLYTKLEKGNKKIRIKDIATRAGVSTGTVDRVLHNRGEVKEHTRNKVMEIVDEMGYTPNLLARSLAKKKPAQIAVLFPSPNSNNPYWKQPANGIKMAIDELNDYSAELDTISFDATSERSFIDATNRVLQNSPDGIVFNPVFQKASQNFITKLQAQNIPFIFFDINIQEAGQLSYYGQNSFKSGYAAAKLFYKSFLPNSELLIVNLANNKNVSHHIHTRGEGFKAFFNDSLGAEITIHNVDIDLLGENEPAHSLEQKLQKHPNIKGIFVPSSRVFKVAEFLMQKEIKKIFLVGYDIVDENIKALQNDVIDFLICQKPQEQAYKAILAMFNFIMTGKKPELLNYSPIDIIFKENIHFYKTFK